jgi:short-subunit dehydrogenase
MSNAIKSIIITGASGAIGSALAKAFSSQGITLGVVGRNHERLQAVRSECEKLGATVIPAVLDVTEYEPLCAWLLDFDRQHPVDVVIANAGAASTIGPDKQSESWEDLRRVFDTNLYGTLGTVSPLVERMRERGKGQIAMISSLGGYVGMPISPAYSGSKAAVKAYGEALRGILAPMGIGVTVICPGFVRSAMSDCYPASTPFMLSADKAAEIIKKGVEKNRARISFPFPLNVGAWFLSVLPSSLNLAIQRFLRFY